MPSIAQQFLGEALFRSVGRELGILQNWSGFGQGPQENHVTFLIPGQFEYFPRTSPPLPRHIPALCMDSTKKLRALRLVPVEPGGASGLAAGLHGCPDGPGAQLRAHAGTPLCAVWQRWRWRFLFGNLVLNVESWLVLVHL